MATPFPSPDAFAEGLLEEQFASIDEHLTAHTLEPLLQLCEALADTGPLVHLARRCGERGLVLPADSLLRFGSLALQAVLELPGLERPASEAWKLASMRDLVSFCLLDRYLRRRVPEVWDHLRHEAVSAAEQCLHEQQAPSDGLLLRLPGSDYRDLSARHPRGWASWDAHWRTASRAALRLLSERPRDVSQANAERLLSSQVYTDPGHFLLELLQNADDAGASRFRVEFSSDRIVVRHNGAPFDFRDLVGLLSIGQTTKKSTQIGYFGVGFKSIYEVTQRPRLRSGHFCFEIADISVPRALADFGAEDETTLVLPLKAGADLEHLWQRALGVDAALLLQLPHLRRLEWCKDGEQSVVSLEALGGDEYLLRRGGQARSYLLWTGLYQHAGERPVGKATVARVNLAMPLDDAPVESSLYSFLPITEQSGLRFVVGSHFDVPVDRERLDPSSEWNRGLLEFIPHLLSQRFAADPQAAWRMLALLPLPDDALAPMFTDLPDALAVALAPLPLVPGGRLAREVRVIDAALEELFDEEQPFKDERQRAWLVRLGAQVYDADVLLADLQAGHLPGRLARSFPEDWSRLHRALASTTMPLDRLRLLPLFLDRQGNPTSAVELTVLDAPFLDLFVEPPRSVHPELVANPDSAALLARLGVTPFGWRELSVRLHRIAEQGIRLDMLYRLLPDAPQSTALAMLDLPLFRDTQGQLAPIATPATHRQGLVAVFPGVPRELFPRLRFLAPDPDVDRLLESLGWPRLDLPGAIDALKEQTLAPEDCDRLLQAVEDWEGSWSSTASAHLVCLNVFAGSDGRRYPLRQLWRFDPPTLAGLLPHLPELERESISERVVRKLALERQVSEGNLDTLLAELPQLNAEIALVYLAAHARQLSRAQLERLFALPIFEGRPLGPTGAQAAKPEYIESFQALGVPVLSADFTRMLEPLLQVSGIRPLGMPKLVESLRAKRLRPELLSMLRGPFLADAEELQLSFSKEARQQLPVWLCLDGEVRTALDVPPTDLLAELTGRPDARPAPDQEEWLDLFPLPEPAEFLSRVLQREARLERPLREQPFWLNTVQAVDRVSAELRHPLQVDVQTRLLDTSLYYGSPLAYPILLRSHFREELMHPDSSPEQRQRGSLLPPSFVLETFVALRDDRELRQAFYAYVDGDLSAIAAEPEARRLLTELPLWRSTSQAWKSLAELVLDPDFPADLGGDWTPHPEVPLPLLERLQGVLGVGRPDPETMLREHLLPAYGRGRSREKLLGVMSRMATGLDVLTLRRLLRPPDGNGSFPLPQGGDLQSSYCPPDELGPLPSLPAVSGERLEFLRRLGLNYLPGAGALRGAAQRLTREDGEALLRLVEWAWENSPEALDPLWETLAELRWLPNRRGTLKVPRQLFGRSAELKELIGGNPELFVARRIPAALARKLGLKGEADLDGALVVAHLRDQVHLRQRVSSRVYRFLDSALLEGRIAAAYLREALRGLDWVWTDEGEYRPPAQVLGVPAFRYFGAQRGTWEGGHERYPALARLFAIPAEVTPEVVLDFLQQVRLQPAAESMVRLLRACLAFLGEREDARFPRQWRVIPARLAGERSTVLVAADTAGLVRSNSPTLEALFAQAGRLYLADPGDAAQGPALDRLYERVGIPRLRDAYTVTPDAAGRDVTEGQREMLTGFRALLRALHAVTPRLRAARPELDVGEWLAESRLRHFASSGPIRVLDELALAYELPGVGRVRVEAAAAFHPEREELLVSSEALLRPDRHAVALADGLLDCIYQGPGSEGLLDLLNLLIPMLDRESMDRYLDRRHFPRPFGAAEDTPETRVSDRLGEFLDFGLQRMLEHRFPELAGLDWSRWRAGQLPLDARGLLEALGLQRPSEALVAELERILQAPSLEVWSSSLLEAAPEPLPVAARQPWQETPAEAPAPAPTAPSTSLAGKVMERIGQWLGSAQPGAMQHNRESIGDLAETYRHPPQRHLLVSTRALQGNDLYCLNMLGVNFDARRQVYLPGAVPWPDTFVASGRTVDFSGRLPIPDGVVPKPLGSRFTRLPAVPLQGPGSYGEYRSTGADTELSYSVELSKRPDHRVEARLRSVDPQLVRPTAPDSALPKMVHDWISWARAADLLPWQLAERARDFVIAHYLYDLKFLDDPEMRAYAQQPAGTGENRALSLLHQGRSGRYLGRGVCFELSALLLEMLRRAGIPSVLGSVWALDLGLIHRPDHALVMVYLASDRGPCWAPVDPSQNRLESHKQEEATRADLLQAAVDLVFGPAFEPPSEGVERERVQELALIERLGNARRLEVLLEFIANSRYVRELDDDLRALIDEGWLQAGKEQLYRVWTEGR